MKAENETWQQEARKAFQWLDGMYQQAQALLTDAEAFFGAEDWQVRTGSGWGGAYMSNWNLAEWPFIFLKAFAVLPKDHEPDAKSGRAALFGIFFYDEDRKAGPMCFGAVARWNDSSVSIDHKVLYRALGGGTERRFKVERQGEIGVSTPLHAKYRGLDEIRWFEVPLSAIRSPEALKSVVAATIALFGGEEAQVRESVVALVGP